MQESTEIPRKTDTYIVKVSSGNTYEVTSDFDDSTAKIYEDFIINQALKEMGLE
ncbi:hypothetical protein FACS189499_07710 [Clostridia bacterium]|nr:hypothetical protein FACS189499_07710 [Clostridia bacterium]